MPNTTVATPTTAKAADRLMLQTASARTWIAPSANGIDGLTRGANVYGTSAVYTCMAQE